MTKIVAILEILMLGAFVTLSAAQQPTYKVHPLTPTETSGWKAAVLAKADAEARLKAASDALTEYEDDLRRAHGTDKTTGLVFGAIDFSKGTKPSWVGCQCPAQVSDDGKFLVENGTVRDNIIYVQ